MAIQEPSGLHTIEAATDDSHEDYNDNVSRENVLQVRYIRAQVGEAAGVSTHDQVYIKPADGKFYKAQATSDLSTMPSCGFILEGKAQDQFAKAIREGYIQDDGWSLTIGDVLVLSSTVEGGWSFLSDEIARDIAPFAVQQVLGFVVESDKIFVCVNRPALIAGGVFKEIALEESTEDPLGYGDRGLLRIEDVDGTLELVYYDNGGQRTQITVGGRLSVGIEVQHVGDYGWLTCERLQFGCGTLELIEPGVVKYTPPINFPKSSASTDQNIEISFNTEKLFELTLEDDITVSFTNGTTADRGQEAILIVIQDGTGSREITWDGQLFPGSVEPVLTETADAEDIFEFVWDGSSWHLTNAIFDSK